MAAPVHGDDVSWWLLYALLYGIVVGFVVGALVVTSYRNRRERRVSADLLEFRRHLRGD